jgi:outer membrane murein-binding lipoprotein Lpp
MSGPGSFSAQSPRRPPQTEQGQDYVQTLWAALQDSGTASDDRAAEAEAAEIDQAQAQARLDGLVRQVR